MHSFWLPEPALSLYGLPEYETLAPEVKRRLSQYEFINVMQAGLWLERAFVQRLSRRLEAALRAAGVWRVRTLTAFMNLLLKQFVGVFYLPPARFDELAGLTRGRCWRAAALTNPVHRAFVMQCLAPTLRVLESHGLKPSL